MSTFSATCRTCMTDSDLDAAHLHLRLAGPGSGGACLYACRSCGSVAEVALTPAEVAVFRAAGVRAVSAAPDEAPGTRAERTAPPLTLDDVLELHLVLSTDDWFDRLTGLSRRSN